MYLYLCAECERGNHGRCYRTKPSHPPGSFGGSKCRCGCDGNADFVKPISAEEADQLWAQVQAMTFEQLRLLWRWVTMEMGGRIETGTHGLPRQT